MSGARAIWWSGTTVAPATRALTSLRISVACCCEPPSRDLETLLGGDTSRPKESLRMKTLIIEHTAPFQGLPELVADAEGLFAREGLQIAWVNTNEGANQDTAVGSRQLGRRGIVTFAAIVVAPDSPIYTPQQLASRKVGVPFYFGTHYLALHMLEGFLTREQIVVCSVPHGSRYRLDLLMRREIEGTTLTEPYVTLAEKKGCRVICSQVYHGTHVGTAKIDVETMRAYNRAVGEAVRRINANRRKYLQYFIDYHKAKDPEIGTLTVDDLRESRLVVCEPAPIPRDEMQRTYDWVKSWGMLEATQSPLQLVDDDVQTQAHATG